MYTDEELVSLFKKGMSKSGLTAMVYCKAKEEKNKIQKYEALKIVEQAILNDFIKNKQFI